MASSSGRLAEDVNDDEEAELRELEDGQMSDDDFVAPAGAVATSTTPATGQKKQKVGDGERAGKESVLNGVYPGITNDIIQAQIDEHGTDFSKFSNFLKVHQEPRYQAAYNVLPLYKWYAAAGLSYQAFGDQLKKNAAKILFDDGTPTSPHFRLAAICKKILKFDKAQFTRQHLVDAFTISASTLIPSQACVGTVMRNKNTHASGAEKFLERLQQNYASDELKQIGLDNRATLESHWMLSALITLLTDEEPLTPETMGMEKDEFDAFIDEIWGEFEDECEERNFKPNDFRTRMVHFFCNKMCQAAAGTNMHLLAEKLGANIEPDGPFYFGCNEAQEMRGLSSLKGKTHQSFNLCMSKSKGDECSAAQIYPRRDSRSIGGKWMSHDEFRQWRYEHEKTILKKWVEVRTSISQEYLDKGLIEERWHFPVVLKRLGLEPDGDEKGSLWEHQCSFAPKPKAAKAAAPKGKAAKGKKAAPKGTRKQEPVYSDDSDSSDS